MKPKHIVCPSCGSYEGFASHETIHATADVHGFSLDSNGRPSPDYAGETEIHWDTQEQVSELAYACNRCGHEFSEPLVCDYAKVMDLRRKYRASLKASA